MCKVQKKGRCGTEYAHRNCLRRAGTAPPAPGDAGAPASGGERGPKRGRPDPGARRARAGSPASNDGGSGGGSPGQGGAEPGSELAREGEPGRGAQVHTEEAVVGSAGDGGIAAAAEAAAVAARGDAAGGGMAGLGGALDAGAGAEQWEDALETLDGPAKRPRLDAGAAVDGACAVPHEEVEVAA